MAVHPVSKASNYCVILLPKVYHSLSKFIKLELRPHTEHQVRFHKASQDPFSRWYL